MNKVLIGTVSALALSSGVAQAQTVSTEMGGMSVMLNLHGKAEAGYIARDEADGGNDFYSGVDIDITASTTTDTGVSISVGADIGGGHIGDFADQEIDEQGTTISDPSLTIAYNGAMVTIDGDGVDNLYDDGLESHDLLVGYDVGGFNLNVAVTDDPNEEMQQGSFSYAVAYTGISGFEFTIAGTNGDRAAEGEGEEIFASTVASVTYSLGNLAIGLEADNRSGDMLETEGINTLSFGYDLGDIMLAASADDNDDWNASVSYSGGANSFTVETDEETAWEVHGSRDLGGGATVNAAINHNEVFMMGLGFTF